MRAAFLYIVAALILFASPVEASVTISPAVIDHKAKARDILKESVTIVNRFERKINVYPVVNNVLKASGKEEFADPSRADLSDSLANWVEFPRGVELEPGERRTIPFEIRVNLTAKPGIYHAAISFPEGPNRDAAEKIADRAPVLSLNLEVEAEVRENLQIKKFIPDSRFFWTSPATLRFELENLGNRPETPAGDILIYDRNGREVASLDGNLSKDSIPPAARKELSASWDGRSFGQYKAVLTLRYGADGTAQVQDTIFFWVIPWYKAALLALAFSLGFMSIAYYVSRRLHRAQFLQSPPGRHHSGLASDGIPHVVDLRHPPRHDS